MKYWSQNMKDENKDPSNSLELMKVWLNLKNISIGKLIARKIIRLCIIAVVQESGKLARAEDTRTGKSTKSCLFFFNYSFLVHAFRNAFLLFFH